MSDWHDPFIAAGDGFEVFTVVAVSNQPVAHHHEFWLTPVNPLVDQLVVHATCLAEALMLARHCEPSITAVEPNYVCDKKMGKVTDADVRQSERWEDDRFVQF